MAKAENAYTKRKAPTQKRAKATVDSILQATAELIEQEGWSSATINRIIAHSGVSVGSLYQYFPNREAIFLALFEDISTKMAVAIKDKMIEFVDEPPTEGMPGILGALMEVIEDHQLILLRFVDDVPEMRQMTQSLSARNLLHGSVRSYIEMQGDQFSYRDLETTVYVIENTVYENIRRYILDQPEFCDREMFVQELSDLLYGYLTRPGH